MRRMIIFDDGRGRFGPMTDLRATFELRTGMLTTGDRIAAHRPKTLAAYWVPRHLAALVRDRADAPVNEFPTDDETLYLVNGRWSLPADVPLNEGQALIEKVSGDVVAAMLRRGEAEYFLTSGQFHERVQTRVSEDRVLYRFPWDILAVAWKTITHDILATRVLDAKVPDPGDVRIIGEHPVEIHESAKVFPNVVLDATLGPIIVMERAVIRPNAVLCGPCAIGADTTIIDHALIKPNTAIGPCCKVGGEVGATIFQGFSNKCHDGHLGDSWIGEWVNFGAGTTNSNLLNTYSEVAMRLEPDGQRQRTGLTFLGAIVGDHAKFAINTRLMTGTVIGTGAMLASASPPPTTTRRFAWITDEGERAYRFDKFCEVMKAVMARRRIEPSPAYIESLRALHDRHVRKEAV